MDGIWHDVVSNWAAARLADEVRKYVAAERPEIAGRFRADDEDRPRVCVDFERDSVFVAYARVGAMPGWFVDAASSKGPPTVWLPDARTLGDCLLAKVDAVVGDRPVMASPWRWNESEATPIVDLADSLVGQGLRVHTVVGSNRHRIVEGRDRNLAWAHYGAVCGDFVQFDMDGRAVQVSRLARLGWVVDEKVGERCRRLHPVEWDENGSASGLPLVGDVLGPDRITEILRAGAPGQVGRPDEGSAGSTASGWSEYRPVIDFLIDMGYRGDGSLHGDESHANIRLDSVSVSIFKGSNAGVSEIRAGMSLARQRERRPLFFARDFTPPARALARAEGVPLFWFAGPGRPTGADPLAAELCPQWRR